MRSDLGRPINHIWRDTMGYAASQLSLRVELPHIAKIDRLDDRCLIDALGQIYDVILDELE